MPDQYEAIRNRLMREQGLSEDAAQTKAAKIYNSQHPNNPVTGKHPRKQSSDKSNNPRPPKQGKKASKKAKKAKKAKTRTSSSRKRKRQTNGDKLNRGYPKKSR